MPKAITRTAVTANAKEPVTLLVATAKPSKAFIRAALSAVRRPSGTPSRGAAPAGSRAKR